MNLKPGTSAGAAADNIFEPVEGVRESARTAVKEFLGRVSRLDLNAAVRCAENSAGVLCRLNQAQQSFFLGQAMVLADIPGAAAEFFCGCPDLVYSLGEENMRSWVEQGRAIGRKNPEAAIAFFKRESMASLSALRGLRRSVNISEVSRLLQLYCTAVGGRNVGVKSTAEAPEELVRQGHHLPLTDGKTIYLPERLDKSPSRRENFEDYKALAAHQAGYIEFGTFDLDIDVLLCHPGLAAFRKPNTAVGPIASHYELFFNLFNDPWLARDIFFAIEDSRVDFRLRRQYQGLAGHLEKAALAALEDRPKPSSLPLREALVESLIRFSLKGPLDETLPEEALSLCEAICGTAGRVLDPRATVLDSAAAAAQVYLMLGALPNIFLVSPFLPSVASRVKSAAADETPGIAAPGPGISEGDEEDYSPAQPVTYRGQTRPELVQFEMSIELLKDALNRSGEDGIPLTPEMLAELLRRGAKIKITQMTAKELAEASGLFVSDIEGVWQEKLTELSPDEKKKLANLLDQASVLKSKDKDSARAFFYHEWDYLIGDYRPDWCTLREVPLEGGSSGVVSKIQKEHSALILSVRRHFQRIRPEMMRKVKRLRMGDDIVLNDAIEAVIDRKAGLTPSDRIYQKRDRRTRDVATAFLLDLSASTNEWIEEEPAANSDSQKEESAKRVIDIEREAVVIMAEALESLGDEYAIYGFSGHCRDDVEFFNIKDFSENYSERVRRRLGAVKPRASTRMGPAIRHALKRLSGTGCRLKVLILLSDGYPQDLDYGPDRRSRDYGLHDTTAALQEARGKNVHTFILTVDQAGNDYLREMCDGENYLVVERPSALPRILPRVYRGLTV